MAADVLVIGGGMAGLSAARALAVHGLSVILLEAQTRVGGRILTRRVGEETIELGAEFVHGRPPTLLALIEEAGLELVEREGSTLRFNEALLTPEDDDEEDHVGDLLEELEDHAGEDISFAEFLAPKKLPESMRTAAIGFVEGFNAADHQVISVAALGVQQKAENAMEGHRTYHVRGGYDQLPEFLAKRVKECGGKVHFNTSVRQIEWRQGEVIATDGEESFSARRAIVALPLGVLQCGQLQFSPALPEVIKEVLEVNGQIRMGHALRFTLIFKKSFWKALSPQPALGEMSFLFTPGQMPPVWWTPCPEISNTITGWIGGPRSALLEGLDTDELGEHACGVLAKVFQLEAAQVHELLIGCHMHDWSSDPYSAGAYSYIAKGGMDAPKRFAGGIAGTLYFAGEHTTTDGHWGTVHAALDSGTRVAMQVLEHIAAE